ncbi:hypothetical protein BDP55DRAFT_347679 [Colletotrichum godetiae]|uniref:Uncharacterized protein n=1 Tax=Colletotrichum godetiae TaxID=1209918 RepID=A0AAJ0F2D3_9PEZI|nr:uncharacterized protein BDP55DRAFT_347679 [Colletotrichum godetiae]KAK1690373.1 hypothetical protein BDP55DRAFT_347679 [Colletotrichum godetiae]
MWIAQKTIAMSLRRRVGFSANLVIFCSNCLPLQSSTGALIVQQIVPCHRTLNRMVVVWPDTGSRISSIVPVWSLLSRQPCCRATSQTSYRLPEIHDPTPRRICSDTKRLGRVDELFKLPRWLHSSMSLPRFFKALNSFNGFRLMYIMYIHSNAGTIRTCVWRGEGAAVNRSQQDAFPCCPSPTMATALRSSLPTHRSFAPCGTPAYREGAACWPKYQRVSGR